VTSFAPGQLTCRITESSVPPGYTESYIAGPGVGGIADSISGGDTACIFSGVAGGDFACEIFNRADPATFAVNKDWVIAGSGDDSIIEGVEVTITCENKIVDGWLDSKTHFWQKSGNLGDGDSLIATIDTTHEPATCWANENIVQSGVEGSDDCGPREIVAGASSECTFVNTVFYEGIPTLNRHGLTLLVLLMVGAGSVGFRRFI
jgi:hypothetical protein